MAFRYFALCFLSLTHAIATASPTAKPADPVLGELEWVDQGSLTRQRELIQDLSFKKIAAQIRGDKRDLQVIQALLDGEHINQTQNTELQALGVILGDVYVKELHLEWKTYADQYGKSRAVCMPRTEYCLFPITMISKRARLGAKIDVQDLYQHGADLISKYVPRLPYSAKK